MKSEITGKTAPMQMANPISQFASHKSQVEKAISDRRFAISERGIALVMSLFILVVIMILGTVFVAMMGSETDISVRQKKSTQALYIAEAGAEVAVYSLVTIDDWTGLGEKFFTMGAFGGGTFSVYLYSVWNPDTWHAKMSCWGYIYEDNYTIQRAIEMTISQYTKD